MKKLILLRHAKSVEDPVGRDFDRPLNRRGKRAGIRMGQWFADEGVHFDAVLASPALRVRATIEAVEQGIGFALAPKFEPRIYLASAATLLEVVQATDDAAASLLLVGHNPGLEDLVLILAAEGDALRAQAEIKYPTATIAVLEVDVARWADVDEGRARLRHFVRPRDLDPSLGPDR
ncbi:MAG: SixA phosphatase family protein [Polymorphobacter sp.]